MMGRHSEERGVRASGPVEPVGAIGAGSGSAGGYWGAPSPEDALSLPLVWEWYGDEETPPRPVVDVPLPDDPEHTALWDFRDQLGDET